MAYNRKVSAHIPMMTCEARGLRTPKGGQQYKQSSDQQPIYPLCQALGLLSPLLAESFSALHHGPTLKYQ